MHVGIAEEEEVLSDLVDTGTTLVSMIVEVITSTESLSCIAGKLFIAIGYLLMVLWQS